MTPGWRRLSPSAELFIDPESGARCAVRDTGAPGIERYLWTVTVFGDHQLTEGRTGELAEARSQAEAVRASNQARSREQSEDQSGMPEGQFSRLFWVALDCDDLRDDGRATEGLRSDYGLGPPTAVDEIREVRRRGPKALPVIDFGAFMANTGRSSDTELDRG